MASYRRCSSSGQHLTGALPKLSVGWPSRKIVVVIGAAVDVAAIFREQCYSPIRREPRFVREVSRQESIHCPPRRKQPSENSRRGDRYQAPSVCARKGVFPRIAISFSVTHESPFGKGATRCLRESSPQNRLGSLLETHVVNRINVIPQPAAATEARCAPWE